MIRTVIFDIGNVLAGFAWRPFYESLGFHGEILERLADATARSDDWKEYDRGCLTDEEIVERFVENDPAIEEQIRRANASLKGMMERYEYSIPWLQGLRKAGYQVLVLSNFSRKALVECWRELDFLPYTDGGVLSYQVKLLKPMPEIYLLLMDRFRLDPASCVFVDDIQENVDMAVRLGMRGIRFENVAQAQDRLRGEGVLW